MTNSIMDLYNVPIVEDEQVLTDMMNREVNEDLLRAWFEEINKYQRASLGTSIEFKLLFTHQEEIEQYEVKIITSSFSIIKMNLIFDNKNDVQLILNEGCGYIKFVDTYFDLAESIVEYFQLFHNRKNDISSFAPVQQCLFLELGLLKQATVSNKKYVPSRDFDYDRPIEPVFHEKFNGDIKDTIENLFYHNLHKLVRVATTTENKYVTDYFVYLSLYSSIEFHFLYDSKTDIYFLVDEFDGSFNVITCPYDLLPYIKRLYWIYKAQGFNGIVHKEQQEWLFKIGLLDIQYTQEDVILFNT